MWSLLFVVSVVSMARHTKPKLTGDEVVDSQSSTSKSAKLDKYGCVNWNITELPEGETFETLEIKRKEMLSLFHKEGPYCTAS